MLVSKCSPHQALWQAAGAVVQEGKRAVDRDRWTLLSAPGALKNSGHRRLRKDAVNLGDAENKECFPKFVARRSWMLLRFLFSQSAEGTGMEHLPVL